MTDTTKSTLTPRYTRWRRTQVILSLVLFTVGALLVASNSRRSLSLTHVGKIQPKTRVDGNDDDGSATKLAQQVEKTMMGSSKAMTSVTRTHPTDTQTTKKRSKRKKKTPITEEKKVQNETKAAFIITHDKRKYKKKHKPKPVIPLAPLDPRANLTLPFKPRNLKYIETRHDRAGSVIWDLLKAHAFLFQRGDKFAGSCGYTTWRNEVEALLTVVGLQHVLKYKCPGKTTKWHKHTKNRFVSRSKYRHDEKHTFTPEWMEYMKQVMVSTQKDNSNNNTESQPLTVAIHIRRGDVSLCTDNANRRYLPNSYYLRLMDRVVEQHPNREMQVTIYSESPINYRASKGTQYEDWSDFTERNYTLHLDGDTQSVWRAFIDADILITSMSGFSLTPAVLRLDRPGVIFTPHQHAYMLPHWELVPEADMQQMAAERRQMQKERCPYHGREVFLFDDPSMDYDRHYYTKKNKSTDKKQGESTATTTTR